MFDKLNGATVRNIGVETTVAGITGSWCAGGIANEAQNNSLIENCYVKGIITGDNRVGGIVGDLRLSTVRNCYSTGNIGDSGSSSDKGGIVGNTNNYSVVTKCFSTATVTNNSWAGGIVGLADSTASITNNVAINNSINGNYNPNRIISGTNGATVSDNIAKVDIAVGGDSFDQTSLGYGISKTDAQLKDSNTYKAIGWDFTNIWKMPVGGGYPILYWQ